MPPQSLDMSQPATRSEAQTALYGTGGNKLTERRHREWQKKRVRWQWLLDSWEGGEEYRQAIYGTDKYGLPVRNLVRHKREYPHNQDPAQYGRLGRPDGTDPAQEATDNDYELRRARAVIPSFVKEAVEGHLSDIYAQEIRRNVPPECERWFEDVDGCGSELNDWMQETVAPLLLVLGQLDIVMGRPMPPPGREPQTRAEEIAMGMDAIVASFVMPTNVVWWLLDSRGRYREVLIREPSDIQPEYENWRHWHEKGWDLYDKGGEKIDGGTYAYGRPPIIRLFYRKSPRYRNVGISLYEEIAENQREFYNRDSELILSDTVQAFPLLQGPEDYASADSTLPIGPTWMLPKKKHQMGTTIHYEGFEVVEFPKEGAASIRENKRDIRDSVDRAAAMTKPAGAAGSTGQTVAQSGISKRLDLKPGEKLLSKIAACLEKAERQMCQLCCMVSGIEKPLTVLKKAKPKGAPPALPTAEDLELEVVYPREFDLFGPEEFANLLADLQAMFAASGIAPVIEADALKAYVRMILRGKPDEVYEAYDAEIDQVIARLAKEKEQERELIFASKTAALEVTQAQAESGGDGGGQPALPPPE